MSESPDGFDLDALLAPVEGEARAGIDLRQDSSPQSLYYRLRDARTEAREVERQTESETRMVRPRRGHNSGATCASSLRKRWVKRRISKPPLG